MDETEGFLCLGHSKWTICTLLSQFCSCKFQIFQLLYWGANSYYPREGQAENGKMDFSQPECGTSFSVPGAFKLDHLHPVKPILFLQISNFSTFILGANSYYPREGKAENGKMEFSHSEQDKGILVPGAFKLDHLQPLKPILFH